MNGKNSTLFVGTTVQPLTRLLGHMRWRITFFLNARNRFVQLVFGKRVGDELSIRLAHQRVQGRRRHILGNQNDGNIPGHGLVDDFCQHNKVFFVLAVDGEGDKFEVLSFRLTEKGQRFGKTEITPGFAQSGLHILDQQIEVLNITADRASDDRGHFRLWHQAAHCQLVLF